MTKFYGLRAERKFTNGDCAAGCPETKAAMMLESDDDLKQFYTSRLRDGFDQMFGHVARKLHNLVADELLRRGITQIEGNIFGPTNVKRWTY
jgi:hypothetical protein